MYIHCVFVYVLCDCFTDLFYSCDMPVCLYMFSPHSISFALFYSVDVEIYHSSHSGDSGIQLLRSEEVFS